MAPPVIIEPVRTEPVETGDDGGDLGSEKADNSSEELITEVLDTTESMTESDIVFDDVGETNNEASDKSNIKNSEEEIVFTSNKVVKTGADNIISADSSMVIGLKGQIESEVNKNEAFAIVGLTIEAIEFNNDIVNIKVIDTEVSQTYSATLIDGSALPEGLEFDPRTGTIKGILPEGVDVLEVSIKAHNAKGETRILNLKLDVKKLKQDQGEKISSFVPLDKQIKMHSHKLESYGSEIEKLFA